MQLGLQAAAKEVLSASQAYLSHMVVRVPRLRKEGCMLLFPATRNAHAAQTLQTAQKHCCLCCERAWCPCLASLSYHAVDWP